MKCIGGSIEVQRRLGRKKWVRRRLWFEPQVLDDDSIGVIYLMVRNRAMFLYTDGQVAGGCEYWRWLKPPEGFELVKFGSGRIVHIRDVVRATKMRLGVE